jgi:hypothetical protein
MLSTNENSFLKKEIKEDIVKIETGFPNEKPHGFNNAEVNRLFDIMPTLVSYTPSVVAREGFCNSVGVTEADFTKSKNGYLEYYKNTIGPKNKDKIKYLVRGCNLKANLAYTTFVSQAYVLAPFFTEMKIPFVFTLYAGGGFGLNNVGSDNNLRDIFSNKYFRRVIVNNDVTRDYLIEKRFCPEKQIEFLFGGFVQFKKNEIDLSGKKFYRKHKGTFDICFVAFNYDDIGRSKGYDLFIESAKRLAGGSKQKNADMRFHVVGDFRENTIDISEIKDKITFYGVKSHEWLLNFYYNMDIAVAPVRPFLLYPGSFDGYPMCFEQSICGVAMFQSDELNINRNYHYYKEDEVVNIKLDVEDIASKIEFYFNNPEKLYDLAEKGRQKTQLIGGLEDRANKIKEILLKTKGE